MELDRGLSGLVKRRFWDSFWQVSVKGIDEMTVQAFIGYSTRSKNTREINTHLRKDDIKEKMLEAIK